MMARSAPRPTLSRVSFRAAMPDDTALLGALADEFTARVRRGEAPEVEGYARAHPMLAARIRDLFPRLSLLQGHPPPAAAPAGGAASARALSPGSTFGSYRIECEIGRGGMGTVYEAVHLALDKRVALK